MHAATPQDDPQKIHSTNPSEPEGSTQADNHSLLHLLNNHTSSNYLALAKQDIAI